MLVLLASEQQEQLLACSPCSLQSSKSSISHTLFPSIFHTAQPAPNMKLRIISVLMLRHYDRSRKIILKINFFDYVNNDVLSQYDDEHVLHSVAFYSKNFLSAECNYEIYNKKLLIIIKCLKH